MDKSNELKQTVQEEEGQIAKVSDESGCCGPTCCGGSKNKTNNERKENEIGNSK